MKLIVLAIIVGALTACASPTGDFFIGHARMTDDRTVILDIASRERGGPIAHGHFIYPVEHPQYRQILDHIGTLAPGQDKQIEPWPKPRR